MVKINSIELIKANSIFCW